MRNYYAALILVENATDRLALSRQTAEIGFNILGPASSTGEALQILEAATPNVALLDHAPVAEDFRIIAELLKVKGVPYVWLGSPFATLAATDEPLLVRPVSNSALQQALSELLSSKPRLAICADNPAKGSR